MRVAGLFAGIAGLELGLKKGGHETEIFCEIDEGAKEVLKTHFSDIKIHSDVLTLVDLPKNVNLIAAGFPCQDLSQAGLTLGLSGTRSSLVNQIFRIIAQNDIPNLLIENVPFMLQLNKGHAILHIVNELERLGYNWAYRIVDARAFGLPQRRQRVFVFASKEYEPWKYVFKGNVPEPKVSEEKVACGFYWTEGRRGLGWAIDAVPTLKGGSTVGIASPPAIWLTDNRIVLPSINDGERLQGFERDWTKPAEKVAKKGHRWKLVGNAVSVRAAEWAGNVLNEMEYGSAPLLELEANSFDQEKAWPIAAYGSADFGRFEVKVSKWPVMYEQQHLESFLEEPLQGISLKALSGFFSRLTEGNLHYSEQFYNAIVENISKKMEV